MKKFIYVWIFAIVSAGLLFGWCTKSLGELENNIVRLHVIANSDSPSDQALKLKVRDRLTEFAGLQGTTPDAEQMKTQANHVLRAENAPYVANVSFGEYYVNRREYGSFVLPEGMYTAVRVELGEAKGKNWWCVISPPLCFTKSAFGDTDSLSEYLSSETNVAIGDITVKFKVLEWVSKLVCSSKTTK